jgi:hypothetical protein
MDYIAKQPRMRQSLSARFFEAVCQHLTPAPSQCDCSEAGRRYGLRQDFFDRVSEPPACFRSL